MGEKVPFRVVSKGETVCEGTATRGFLDELHAKTRWDLWGFGENGYTEVSQYTIVDLSSSC